MEVNAISLIPLYIFQLNLRDRNFRMSINIQDCLSTKITVHYGQHYQPQGDALICSIQSQDDCTYLARELIILSKGDH